MSAADMRLDNFTQFQINLTNVDETLMRFNVRLGRFRTSLRRARNDSATRHRACNFIILVAIETLLQIKCFPPILLLYLVLSAGDMQREGYPSHLRLVTGA